MRPFAIIFFLCFSLSLNAQQYNIYFLNMHTDLVQLSHAKQLELGLSAVAVGGGFNGQLAYSPIKHLSLAGGYYYSKRTLEDDGNGEMKKVGYSVSIGTYLYLLNNKIKNKNKNPKIIELSDRRSLLLTAQIGYSFNNLDFNGSTGRNGTFYQGEIEYDNAFLTLGFAYEHNWGLLNLNSTFTNIFYRKAIYNGVDFELDRIGAITDQLREKTDYRMLSIGIHNQVGKKIVRGVVGVTVPVIYFHEFKKQAASLENRSLYAGVIIDIGGVRNYIKSNKN